nr:MAG TPA_asm: ribosome, girodazole, girolline, antibiotic complex, 50S [Caudoviricetes sp.]
MNKLRKPILVDEQVIRYIYECPNCGRTFTDNGLLNYCYHCGQRFDWSDKMGGEK